MTPQMQESFLKCSIPRRIGTIATNANRIARVLGGQNTIEGARDLISESMQFIEWTAPELELSKRLRLAEWQQELGHWRRNLQAVWEDSQENVRAQTNARMISEELFHWMENFNQ